MPHRREAWYSNLPPLFYWFLRRDRRCCPRGTCLDLGIPTWIDSKHSWGVSYNSRLRWGRCWWRSLVHCQPRNLDALFLLNLILCYERNNNELRSVSEINENKLSILSKSATLQLYDKTHTKLLRILHKTLPTNNPHSLGIAITRIRIR